MNIGGAEKELLAYIAHVDRKKYEIHLILTRTEGELLKEVPSYVQIHQAVGNSNIPDYTYLFNLFQVIRKVKPDLIIGFMQDIAFNILLMKVICSPFLAFKVIISEQVVLTEWQKYQHTLWLKRILIKTLYRFASRIFAQSESIQENLIFKMNIEQRKVILMPSFISVHEEVKKKIKTEKPYFLFVGRLDYQKNIEVLFKAFLSFSKNNSTIDLYMVGPINDFYIQLANEMGLQNRVHFLGYIAKPDKYYFSAKALIIPSFVEGRSRVMIEAMLSHCLVICSNFTGHDKYIEHKKTGLVFEKRSSNELLKCLNFVVKNPEKVNIFVKEARKFVVKSHIERHQQQYLSTFKTAVENTLKGNFT